MAMKKATEPRETITKDKKGTGRRKKQRSKKDPNARWDIQEKHEFEECTEIEKKFLNALFGEANFNASKAYSIAIRKDICGAVRSQAHVVYKRVRPIIVKWLDDMGLSESGIKAKILEKFGAKETKFFHHEGKVIETREVEAHAIQLEAVKLAAKILGMTSDKSTREVDQIDRLIEIELEKLAVARQGSAPGKTAETDKPDYI